MATYFVVGIEPFKMAEVRGIHASKKIAVSQAEFLENNKHSLHCQTFKALTATEVKKRKLELYA